MAQKHLGGSTRFRGDVIHGDHIIQGLPMRLINASRVAISQSQSKELGREFDDTSPVKRSKMLGRAINNLASGTKSAQDRLATRIGLNCTSKLETPTQEMNPSELREALGAFIYGKIADEPRPEVDELKRIRAEYYTNILFVLDIAHKQSITTGSRDWEDLETNSILLALYNRDRHPITMTFPSLEYQRNQTRNRFDLLHVVAHTAEVGAVKINSTPNPSGDKIKDIDIENLKELTGLNRGRDLACLLLSERDGYMEPSELQILERATDWLYLEASL